MKECYIGIDYSMTSPGIVILKSKYCYNWVSLSQGFDENKKKSKLHNLINALPNCIVQGYERDKRDNYSENELQKIVNAENLAKQACEAILKVIGDPFQYDRLHFGIEGYAFGAKGNSLIDIVTYSAILRRMLFAKFTNAYFSFYTPSEIKKFAGKGNFKKTEMFEAFVNMVNDKYLLNDLFFHSTRSNYDLIVNTNTKAVTIKDPWSDLIDAYFIVRLLRSQYEID
jgi:hypothetical protein